MNGQKSWVIVLLLAGIFLAGGVTGSFVTLWMSHSVMAQRAAPERWGPTRLKMLAERLELTPSQLEQVRPIVHRDMSELSRLRQEGVRATRQVLQRMEKDIAAVLTPEQRVKFEELNREMHERARRVMERRRHDRRRGSGEGENGPRPPPEKSPGGR